MQTSTRRKGQKLRPWIIFAVIVSSVFPAAGEDIPLDARKSSVSFVGEAFLHRFRGEARDLSGQASIDANAVPPVQKATLHFKTTALTTFNDQRDQKMRDWLQVTGHPEATFQLESVQLLAGDVQQAEAGNPAKFRVTGTFTFHGVTRPITGNASGWRQDDRLLVSGSVAIDTLTFRLPQIREMFMTVGNNVKVSYRFAFVLPRGYRRAP